MKRRCTLLGLILTLLFTAVIVHSAGTEEKVLRISDRQQIDIDQMLAESGSARYFFVAENHDNTLHHSWQLAIIKRLQQNGRQVAIGMEMFTTTSQKKLDQWVAGKLSLTEFKEVYVRDWSLPWSLYEEILLYAREKRIPLIGLNLPKGISRKVAQEGFDALTPQERRLLPAGVTCSVGPAYMAFIRQAYASHNLQDKAFAHFCEAQLLWNRNMGHQLAEFQTRNPRYAVVALVGIGHALKKGAPDEVTRETDRYRVILPEFAGLNRNNLTTVEADYLLIPGSDSGK